MPGGDWRAWLARHVGATALAGLPPAHLAATAIGVPPAGTWFATPVALVAALDHVRMPADGWLTLAPDEAHELSDAFAREFGGSGHSLAPVGAEGFLLSGLSASRVCTHDPARVLAADIAPWLASGEGAAAARRLGAELEMWLHGLPLNRARARRGAAPIATLWLWGGGEGGGAASAADALGARPRGYGADGWLRGLWAALGLAVEGEAGALGQVDIDPDADTVVVVRQGVDEDVIECWCRPALAQLAARRVGSVQCVIDDRLFRFARFDLVKPWRRTVRWAATT